MKPKNYVVPEEFILQKIFLIRGQKVMIDRDLAEIYDIETKRLKEAVKRNLKRFPIDFMFEMSATELEIWRSRFASSNSVKMGLRHKPYCFTEHGVLMLSSALNSEKAIDINIQIMRIFAKIRQMLMDNAEIRSALEKLDRKTDNNTKNIEVLFRYFDEFIEKERKPRKKIGYKP
jgi:hypothetical protein